MHDPVSKQHALAWNWRLRLRVRGNGVVTLDVQDTAKLKARGCCRERPQFSAAVLFAAFCLQCLPVLQKVLFGGDPWLIYCGMAAITRAFHSLPLRVELKLACILCVCSFRHKRRDCQSPLATNSGGQRIFCVIWFGWSGDSPVRNLAEVFGGAWGASAGMQSNLNFPTLVDDA